LSLQDGESHFRRLLEKLPLGAYTCDPDGLITYFNQHAVHLWGRARSSTTRGPLLRLVQVVCARRLTHRPRPLLYGAGPQTNAGHDGREIVIERPDGRRLTALAHANPIHDESGNLIGAVNVLMDITERKRSEEELDSRVAERTAALAAANEELRRQIAERGALERQLERKATHDHLTDLPTRRRSTKTSIEP
jgi:hypothetical protein